MPTEITITIRSDELKVQEKHLIYSPIELSHEDATLKKLIDDMLSRIQGKLVDPEITIRARMHY